MATVFLVSLALIGIFGTIGIIRNNRFPPDEAKTMKCISLIVLTGNLVASAPFSHLFDKALAGKQLRPMLELLPGLSAVLICSLLIFVLRREYTNSDSKPLYLLLGFFAGLTPFASAIAALKLASYYSGFTLAD